MNSLIRKQVLARDGYRCRFCGSNWHLQCIIYSRGKPKAVQKGKVARRAGRRLAGKATGRAFKKLFKLAQTLGY